MTTEHNVTDEEYARDGAAAAWFMLLWAGMLFATVLCLIAVIAAGGVL